MKLNFKKILLTGTAIVAVTGFAGAAHALDITANGTWAGAGGKTGANIANANLNDTVNGTAATGVTLTITNDTTADDGSANTNTFAVGAVTNTGTGALTLDILTGTGADLVVGINAANIKGNFSVRNQDANGAAATVTVANALTVGGNLTLTNTETNAAKVVQLNADGAVAVTGLTTLTAGTNAGANAVMTLSAASNTFSKGVVLDSSAVASATLTLDGAVAQVLNGAVNGAAEGEGILNLSNTNGGITLNNAIGTGRALAAVNLTTATATTTVHDIDATAIVFTAAAPLNLYGGTAKQQQVITGAVSGTGGNVGVINVGTTNDAADVRFIGSIGAGANTLNDLIINANSVITIDSTQVARTVGLGDDLDANGTFNTYGQNDVGIAAVDFDLDGKLNSALHSARNTTVAMGGTTHVLTLGGTAFNIGADEGVAAATTTINTHNQINLSTNATLGANNAGPVNTVALEIGRNDFWHASNVNDATALTVINANGNQFSIGDNDAIMRVRLANNGTYSFDNADIIRVVANNGVGGEDLKAALARGNVANGLVIENTALVRLSAFDTNGTDWLASAAGAGGTDRDLTVRVVHQNPHNVLTNSHSANTAQAVMNLNDTNYGSRWGEQEEVNNAAAIAANGIGKGTLGQIQGNDASIAGGNALRAARNNLLTASTVDSATNIAESLSAVVDAGASQAALNVSNDTLKVAGDRLASLRGSETGMAAGNGGASHRFWAQGFGTHASQDRRDGVDGYDADTYGFAVGLDTETISSNGILGVAFSYGDTDVDGDGGFGTNSNVDSYQITLYGDYDIDPATFVTGMLAYTWHDVDTTRHNVGALGVNATGDYDADQFSARASIGRDYLYDTMTVTPNLMAHWSHYDADGYTETGAGNASLNVDHDTINVFELGVGVEASWQHRTASGMDVEPSLHAGYRYDFVGDEVSTTNSFVGGGASFVTDGADPAQHAFNVGAGLDLYTTGNWEFKAAYDFDFRSDYTAHSGLVRAGVKF